MVSQSVKYDKLKALLNSDTLEFAMECHSGLSAVIAEEAFFKCLWASGLSMSAMTGCRDRNELDTSEVCKIVEWMSDHTNIPILVDGDTGGADFNSARIFAHKLVKAGAAGVCLEDKLYPKHNSFLNNDASDLADPEVHAGKIKAMKDAEPTLVVVARLEEFISGAGLEEAYRRALIYQDAGADAILVHSKKKDSHEIDEFMELWNKDKNQGNPRVPIVIVPTKYYTTPTDHFRDIGVSLVIWANHQMRASIKAMQTVCGKLHRTETLTSVEYDIATVSEIFNLQRDSEMEELEKKYLPSYQGTSLILSAVPSRVNPWIPKVLDVIDGKTVLERQVDSFKSQGVTCLGVVGGYHYDKLEEFLDTSPSLMSHVRLLDNADWVNTTEVVSLDKGLNTVDTTLPLFISYGDIVFRNQVLTRMNQSDADIVIAVDPEFNPENYNEFIYGDTPYVKYLPNNKFKVTGVDLKSHDSKGTPSCGSSVGLFKINTQAGLEALKDATRYISQFSDARFISVLAELLANYRVSIEGVYVNSYEWVDINTSEDVRKAGVVSD